MRSPSRLTTPVLNTWRRVDIEAALDMVLGLALVCATLTSATLLMSLAPDGVEAAAREGSGSALRQGIYFACVIITLLASRPLVQPSRLVPFPPRMYVLLAFCLLSLTWSATPFVGLRRLGLTFIVIWLMFRIVDGLGYRRAINIMVWTLVGILVANYLAVRTTSAAVHRYGGSDPALGGNWRGIIPHKNDAGPITAVTIVLLSFGMGRLRLGLRLVLIAAAAYFLLRTHSKTSIGLVGVGLFAGWLHYHYNPAYRVLLVPVLLILGAVLVYAGNDYIPSLLSSLDSSEDAFTGRIQIWQTMIGFLKDHPWWGAGFGSFWDAGPISPANIYGRSWVSSVVAQGHNGYLDNWTQLGIFGLVLTVAVFFLVPLTKLLIVRVPARYGAAAVGVLILQLGQNFTESTMLMRDFFGNLILAFIVACVDNMIATTRVPRLPHTGPSPRDGLGEDEHAAHASPAMSPARRHLPSIPAGRS